MKYPKKFKVGKRAYEVGTLRNIAQPVAKGKIYYDAGSILLATHSGYTDKPLSEGERDTAFWHETMHAILRDMDSPKDRDEAFVEGVARRLAQVVATAEF